MAHETTVAAIHQRFCISHAQLIDAKPEFGTLINIVSNLNEIYNNEEGQFIADMSVTAGPAAWPLLYLEVGLSQKWADLLAKIKKILESPTVLGVIAIDLFEKQKFQTPDRIPTVDDYISREEWFRCVTALQTVDPFGPLVVRNHLWMGDVECNIYIFVQGEPIELPVVKVTPRYCYRRSGYFLTNIL